MSHISPNTGLKSTIEGVKGRKLPAVLTFIDFRKAFDSVHCIAAKY